MSYSSHAVNAIYLMKRPAFDHESLTRSPAHAQHRSKEPTGGTLRQNNNVDHGIAIGAHIVWKTLSVLQYYSGPSALGVPIRYFVYTYPVYTTYCYVTFNALRSNGRALPKCMASPPLDLVLLSSEAL